MMRQFEQSDQFDWISAYLKDRGIQTLWRRATFISTAAQATVPLVMLAARAGPDHASTRAVAVASSVVALTAATLWLRRWPTRRQSIAFCIASSAAVAATCLALSNPYSGLLGCATFAILGGFIAYFHSNRYMVANFALASVCTVILAARLITSTGDIALTCASLITVAGLNIGVPFGIQFLVDGLRADLRSSDRDPLTGLYNRRSFYTAVYQLLLSYGRVPGTYLVVAVIDLDRFKQLNDTRGHAVGDQALIAVAAALQASSRPDAVIGRTGGEEFVVVDMHTSPNPAKMAEQLREAIAEIPVQITASIGTCGVALDTSPTADEKQLVDDLISTSDAAMYDAKRAGGNQVCHYSALVRSSGE